MLTKIKLLISFLCISAPLFVADALTDDDVFDDGTFDSEVAASKSSDDKNKLSYLPGVVFVGESRNVRLVDTNSYGSDMRFYGKGFVKATKPDIGSIYLGCNFSYFLFAGTNSNYIKRIYANQSVDPTTVNLTLSEFHFSFDVKKKVFVRIGQQLLSWGASYFWSPTDFVNQQPEQPSVISVVDRRAGKPGIRIHLPMQGANLFLFTDFSGVNIGGRFGSLGNTVGQAWRLDFTALGVNIGTNGYVGNNQPVRFGLDATGNALATDIYGETAITMRKNDKQPAYAASIGGARAFGQEKNWTGRAEFFYNDTGYGDTRISSLAPGSFTPFYSGRYYMYGEITGTKLFSSTFGVSLFGFINWADLSYSPTLLFNFTLPRIVPFALYATYYGGPDDREFTSLYRGRALLGGARVQIEF